MKTVIKDDTFHVISQSVCRSRIKFWEIRGLATKIYPLHSDVGSAFTYVRNFSNFSNPQEL